MFAVAVEGEIGEVRDFPDYCIAAVAVESARGSTDHMSGQLGKAHGEVLEGA